ncbi:PREDICTED: uncharacterized protein LOC106814543 isoform X2 [Priapulus caudatus]|uniref:Uncharacterized protein LOC106814543 isoform X2 n=1 Tax=Priapulus caudatus TaxID=37621 RepID=A0ABM1EQ77_PRICU|nr:PREDICTED: uncharacterized protein LOC106814543 isoform X2 [Priapulus caudatus]
MVITHVMVGAICLAGLNYASGEGVGYGAPYIGVHGEGVFSPENEKKPLDYGITYQGCFQFSNDFIMASYRRIDAYNLNLKCAIACQYWGYILALTAEDLCVCSNDLPYTVYISNLAGAGSLCENTCPGVKASKQYNCVKDECCGGDQDYKHTIFSVYSTGNVDVYAQIKRRLYRSLTLEGRLNHLFGSHVCPAAGGYGYGNQGNIPAEHIEMDLYGIELHLDKLTRVLKKNVHPYYEAVPLGVYDGQLDNTDSPYPSTLIKFYEITDTYEDSYGTDTGISRDIAVSAGADPDRQVYALGLPGKVAASFSSDAAEGKSFSSSYSHAVAVEITQGIEVDTEVPEGHTAMINMFLEKDIYVIKWRAQFFTAGFAKIKWCNRLATIHLSQLLNQRQREFFAFGTAKYHDRYQWVAKVTFYDKHGNQLSPEDSKEESKPEESEA